MRVAGAKVLLKGDQREVIWDWDSGMCLLC